VKEAGGREGTRRLSEEGVRELHKKWNGEGVLGGKKRRLKRRR